MKLSAVQPSFAAQPAATVRFGGRPELRLETAASIRFGKRFGTRETGIVATLGPASNSQERIQDLIRAGVNVFRLNFSHGEQPEHGEVIQRIRQAEKTTGKSINILADLQGPKIRVGELAAPLTLTPGQTIYLSREHQSGDPDTIPVTFPALIDALKMGNSVLLSDGTVQLVVNKPADSQGRVACNVVLGGTLTSHKGINLPGVKLAASALSAKDKSDLQFAVDHGANWVAVSFVRSAQDMQEARAELDAAKKRSPNDNRDIKLLAKIEKPEAVQPGTLKKIVSLSDGVMVARGDLGVEADIADLPQLQQAIVHEAKVQGKPVIVATQMLESMMKNPVIPSRSDVSDIADAVGDHADYVMLSGETAVGDYPIETVKMMSRIIGFAEPARTFTGFIKRTFSELGLFIMEWYHQVRARFGLK